MNNPLANPYRSSNVNSSVDRNKLRPPNRLLGLYVLPFCVSHTVMFSVATAFASAPPVVGALLGLIAPCLVGMFYGVMYSVYLRRFVPWIRVGWEPISHAILCGIGQLIWFFVSLTPTLLILPAIVRYIAEAD